MLIPFFLSCKHSNDVYDDSNDAEMYKEYKVSENILKNAGLPVVKIQTENNKKILSKEDWVSANISIESDAHVDWNLDETVVLVRGRGNTTWTYPKRPYAIKFEQKTQICGMPKHKRWILLANYLDGSFMKNEIAFYLSRQLNMDYTVRGEFVNLVLNGNYVGLYWLGEQIKVDKNRVDIDDSEDFLIEMDVYFDELWKFKTEKKHLPVMIKNDDSMTEDRLETIQDWMNSLENVLYGPYFPYTDETHSVYDDSFKNLIDIDSFAKFYIVEEVMNNIELNWPKSTYLTFDKTNNILKAGPVWDFDWSAYTRNTSFSLQNALYYDALFKTNEFSEKINELLSTGNLTTEGVSLKIDEMSAMIIKSAKLDQKRWGIGHNPIGHNYSSFGEYTDNLKACVNSRLSKMISAL